LRLPLNALQPLVVVLTLTVADFAELNNPGLVKVIVPLALSKAWDFWSLPPLIIVAGPEYTKLPELVTFNFVVTEIEELLLHASTSESKSTLEPLWRTCI
jgi:hypothetical protein